MITSSPKYREKSYWGVDNTLVNIRDLINRYKNVPQLGIFDNLNLYQIFDYVRRMPYYPDPENYEWIQSPLRTIECAAGYECIPEYTFGGDCDDKSILLGAIFERMGIPYRMAVVSTLPNKALHHIYPEIFVQGVWLPFDATYDYNQIFDEKPFTLKRIYDWSNLNSPSGKIITYEISQNNSLTHRQRVFNPRRYPSTHIKRVKTLAGGPGALSGVKLAILEGNHCSCGGQCSNQCSGCKTRTCGPKLYGTIIPYTKQYKYHQLAGALQEIDGLGFDVMSIVNLIPGIFNLFSSVPYDDAYKIYERAANALPALSTQANNGANRTASGELAGRRALIAVLLRDYMNPPVGANVCTSSNRCGNRAEWGVIQNEVQNKVSQFAPFMLWMHDEMWSGRIPAAWGGPDLVNYYDMFKNGTGYYPQFVQSQQSQGQGEYTNEQDEHGPRVQKAGMGSPILLLAIAGGIIFYATRKKGR